MQLDESPPAGAGAALQARVRARAAASGEVTAAPPGARDLARLFAVATVTRAVLLTVVPLQALAHLGNAQKVSLLYFVVSAAAVVANLFVPAALRRLPRRTVFVLGACLQIACVPLYVTGAAPAFVLAMTLQVLGIVCTEVTLNVYLLDHIPRRQLVRFEPLRIVYAGVGWMVGPWLGVFLQQNVAPWSPYVFSGLFAAAMILQFRWLQLGERRAVEPRVTRPLSSLRHVGRYFAQPRLALAWLLALVRSCWWMVFFVYAPIRMLETGAGEQTCAAIVSIGTGAIFLVKIWGRVAARRGVRALLVWGYGTTGAITALVWLSPDNPWIVAGLLIASAVCASAIDGAGNVPFLRAVRPLQRPEMLSVFMTYRDASQLVPPAVLSVLLVFTGVPAAFAVTAAAMLSMVHFAGYLHPRL